MSIIVNAPLKAVSAVLLFLLFAACTFASPVEETDEYDSMIEITAREYGIDPLLVKALIWKESRFDSNATGKSGEIGLMQISMLAVRDWAKANSRPEPSKTAVYDPRTNIKIGVWYFSRAFNAWQGNPYRVELALCQYNAGRRKLLNWIAHYDGSYSDVIENSSSAYYVKSIVEKHIEYTASPSALKKAVAKAD